jgi:vacuolar-type H+-ATPase subunit I/STV1
VDTAWRLGYEQGLRDAQTEQAQMQAQQASQMPNQPDQPAPTEEAPGEEQAPGQEQPQGPQSGQRDELGDHIQKLESMIGKSELDPSELQSLKKTLNEIKSIQAQINLTKSLESIKSLKKNEPMNLRVQTNLLPPAKKALSMQEQIVNDIFKKWGEDSSQASNSIASIIGVEGLVKKV